MPYRVALSQAARRAFAQLPAEAKRRVQRRLDQLGDDPRLGAQRLEHPRELYRVRVGAYRLIYAIEDDRLLVLVLAIGHRREIYRKL